MDKHLSSIFDHALLKALLKNTSDIVISLKNDFSILVFNENAKRFFQWKKDVLGKNFLELCEEHGYNCPVHSDFFNQPTPIELIQDLKNARGKLCSINWMISPLSLAHSLSDSVMLIGRDIRVKENNIAHHLDRIVAYTPGSLYWKDLNGRYLGCNDFMVKTASLNSTADIIGKTDYELWPDNAGKITQNDQYVINTGKTVFLEETVKIADGTIMYFTGIKMPLKDEYDNIIGVIGNSLDITKLKKTEMELITAKENAEKANLIKTEFIRNMEHDIRTPFNGVWGLASYLWEHETDTEKKELLGDITLSAQELLDYCNSILDFDRIELGNFPILEKKFNPRKLVESVTTIETPAAKIKKLNLMLDCPDNIPPILLGDQYRLQRILINLVSNAIKFTKEGSIKLAVKLAKQQNDRNVIIMFIVEDTGIGISQEKQDFIYEKFARLNPSNKGIYKGMGLGLRIVKQFIEEMNGDIELKSELGEGSTFSCILPFKLPLIGDV